MPKVFSLFLWDARIKLQRGMAYRFDFIVGLFVSVGYALVGPIFQYLIFTNTKGYPGWNLKQIILFQGIVLTYSGLKGMLFGGVSANVQHMVWRGDFDRLLLKPYEPMKIILTQGFNLGDTGTILSGLIVTGYSISTMGIRISAMKIVLCLIGIICGLALYAGFEILYVILMIMVIQIGRIQDFIDALFNFVGYPAEIFPKTARAVLLTVLPFMAAAWFPARALIGGIDTLIIPGLAVCFIFPFLAFQFWKHMLKKYTSAGG